MTFSRMFKDLCLLGWLLVQSVCLVSPVRFILSNNSCLTMFLSKYNDDDDDFS